MHQLRGLLGLGGTGPLQHVVTSVRHHVGALRNDWGDGLDCGLVSFAVDYRWPKTGVCTNLDTLHGQADQRWFGLFHQLTIGDASGVQHRDGWIWM